jgi:hypothetical protein
VIKEAIVTRAVEKRIIMLALPSKDSFFKGVGFLMVARDITVVLPPGIQSPDFSEFTYLNIGDVTTNHLIVICDR